MSRAPGIGDAAPDFHLLRSDGSAVGLWESLLEGPVAIEFLRGTWCPHARERIGVLESLDERLGNLGARLLVIVAEDPFTIERYFSRRPTSLTVLLDPGRLVVKAWGVHQRFGIERWNIARPSTFVIDRAGYTRYSFVARIRTEAADPEEILELVARL